MDKLDIWTEFSIEHHFLQLVRECQMANATGNTEETEETGISGEDDSLPPFDTVYYERGEN
jgi:hypothetical protein|tara:strand:+ start:1235 stop:1417 length:183 start_codon:yes stop_codon:yes gene_type:complete